MAERIEMSLKALRLENGTDSTAAYAAVVHGDKTTRATVLAEVPSEYAVGSLYLSSAGKLYVKVAIAGAATDWQKVTTTAAD